MKYPKMTSSGIHVILHETWKDGPICKLPEDLIVLCLCSEYFAAK